MMKTIHPLSSFYLSKKFWKRRGRLFEGQGCAYFKFWPIGGLLIRGALIQGFTVIGMVLVYDTQFKTTVCYNEFILLVSWLQCEHFAGSPLHAVWYSCSWFCETLLHVLYLPMQKVIVLISFLINQLYIWLNYFSS